MARIRLRHCTINLLDGYRGQAAVAAADGTDLQINSFESDHGELPVGCRVEINELIYTIKSVVLGPASGRVQDTSIGGSSLDVDEITGRVPVGTKFTIAGIEAGTVFTVTATAEDISGDTENITFTPALDAEDLPDNEAAITFEVMPASLEVYPELPSSVNPADEISILGRCASVKIGDGSLSWDETTNYEYEMDRGEIDAVAEGEDEPVTVNLSMVYEYVASVVGSNVPTPVEILKQKGEAANWISTGADPCELYAVDLEVDYKPPCDLPHEITTFRELRWDSINPNFQDSSIEMRARCKAVEPVVHRR